MQSLCLPLPSTNFTTQGDMYLVTHLDVQRMVTLPVAISCSKQHKPRMACNLIGFQRLRCAANEKVYETTYQYGISHGSSARSYVPQDLNV